MKENGLDRRNLLKAAVGAAIGGAALQSSAEAADKKLEPMTGSERLDALENETTKLLEKIKELKAYKLDSGAGRPIPDMTGATIGKAIADHADRIKKLSIGK